jgi:hypothetical protein
VATSSAEEVRNKRAQSRQQRRDASGQKESPDQDGGGDQGSDSGGGGLGTGALVGIGAAAGGLVGVASAVRRRRRRRADRGADGAASTESEALEAEDGEEDSDDESPRAQKDAGGGPSQLRELATTMLEAALDAVKQHGPQQEDADEDDDEPRGRSRTGERDEYAEDEEDDEEDQEPRGVAGQHEDDAAGAEASRGEDEEDRPDSDEDEPARNGGGALDTRLVRRAREQLAELVGREPEAVTSVERDDGGWRLELEVVEVERVPSSTDVLATYEVRLDEDGDLEEYSRVRRYGRGQADRGGSS